MFYYLYYIHYETIITLLSVRLTPAKNIDRAINRATQRFIKTTALSDLTNLKTPNNPTINLLSCHQMVIKLIKW